MDTVLARKGGSGMSPQTARVDRVPGPTVMDGVSKGGKLESFKSGTDKKGVTIDVADPYDAR